MNDFKSQKYKIIRNLIKKEDALEMGEYLKNNENYHIDEQVPNSISFYMDESILKKQIELLPKIESISGLKLYKTYNYARVYKKGAVLRMHRDRQACEVSVTLDLGGDSWDIWVLDIDENPVKIKLNPGDALLYRGVEVFHWRSKFEGDIHPQVFLHYVDQNGPFSWAKDDKIRRH